MIGISFSQQNLIWNEIVFGEVHNSKSQDEWRNWRSNRLQYLQVKFKISFGKNIFLRFTLMINPIWVSVCRRFIHLSSSWDDFFKSFFDGEFFMLNLWLFRVEMVFYKQIWFCNCNCLYIYIYIYIYMKVWMHQWSTHAHMRKHTHKGIYTISTISFSKTPVCIKISFCKHF